jgi:hypothetical protein
MASFGFLHREALVRTDVSEELTASIIRVIRIGELATDARCEEINMIRGLRCSALISNIGFHNFGHCNWDHWAGGASNRLHTRDLNLK